MAAVLRSVVAPLRVPLLTAGYGLLGVLLAWLWYLENLWWLTIVVAAGSLAAVVLLERCGDAAVTSAPVKAVKFYEARFTAVGFLSAVAASYSTLLTIYFTRVAGEVDPEKELITTVSAALTGLIGGLFLSAKDSDTQIGTFIAQKFHARFRRRSRADATKGQVPLPVGSKAMSAVFATYAQGWVDWSAPTRLKRAEVLERYLQSTEYQRFLRGSSDDAPAGEEHGDVSTSGPGGGRCHPRQG